MMKPDNGTNTGKDRAEVAFYPPILLFALIAIGFAARWLLPARFLPDPWSTIVGLPIVAASFVLFGWAVTTMRRGGASIPPNEPTARLVFRGPYRFSRNPIYLSMVLLLLGIAAWSNSLWFVPLAFILCAALNWGVIVPEERYLELKFGADYTAYKSDVRRWC